jgi:hypothetical protein
MAGQFQYGPQGQIPSAQQATGLDINSIMAGWVDRGTWIYYDTITQAAGATALASYQLFAQPMGTPDQITTVVKTKLQTNLTNSRQFAPPRCLILNQLGFMFTGAYSGATLKGPTLWNDIQAFINSCYFEFVIDSKIFFEGRLEFHPPGYGVVGSSTANNEESWTLGFASPHATYTFGNFAKYIAPLQNFFLTIYFPMGGTLPTWSATGNGINLVVFMKGLTDRSVQ